MSIKIYHKQSHYIHCTCTVYTYKHKQKQFTMYVHDVYNIKSVVHQWYVTFGQQCSISVVKPFFSIDFEINGSRARLKGGGVP